ncbi:MAG: hypothetical protein SGBAC_003303 [Bacillariaceae sp.]
MTVEINGVAYEVDFQPNTATLVYERSQLLESTSPSTLTSSASSSDDVVVGDVKKKEKNKGRFNFSLPSKLKKKLKSRTNKKIKGKSKMASLKSAAFEPSKKIVKKWKASSKNNSKYQDLQQSSGSLFAGRLEEDDEITNLPTVHQSNELKQASFRSKRTETDGVIQEKKSKKRFKRIGRLLKKLKIRTRSSQSSVADTASTTSSPRRSNDHPALRDDTEVALASEDQTFFTIPVEQPLPSSYELSKAVLPPSLTLVQPSSSVARQARAANFVKFHGSMPCPHDEVDYPSDEEDSSVDSIVSPVPCPTAATNTATASGSPRKKILNYKKNKTAKKTKAHSAPAGKTSATVVASSSSSSRSWNVWALLLVTAFGVLSVWQAWFALPQMETRKSVACLATSGANISYVVGGEQFSYNVMVEDNNSDDVEWPYDECDDAPVVSSSIFDEYVKKAKKKFNHPDINLPLPVLAVGFPKAGTSSIFTFFQQQKFRSQHWYCCKAQRDPQRGGPFLMADCLLRHMGHVSQNKTDDKTMLEQCGNFDVFAEINGPRCSDDGNKGCRLEDGTMDTSVPNQQRIFLPQHFNLDFLHDAAPNSTWILNTRLVSDWVESVMNWSDLQHQFANEYHAQGLLDTLPSNETDMKAFLEEIFLNHTEHVKDFVSRHPSHALIEINITDSGAGEVLAESFGLDSSFWTVKNSRWRITWQQSIRFFGGGTWWLMFIATTAYMCSTLGLAMTFV